MHNKCAWYFKRLRRNEAYSDQWCGQDKAQQQKALVHTWQSVVCQNKNTSDFLMAICQRHVGRHRHAREGGQQLMGYKLRVMQRCRSTCKHVNKQKLKRELTMIPAQCGVSLARSEGLTASMRKATTVTATPNSSWSSATSRGKRQKLHLWLSSASRLSSLFLLLLSLSAEPFFSPIAATFF